MLNDILGVLIVNGLLAVLTAVLIRFGLLRRRGREPLGLVLVLSPIGLIAWLWHDATLALIAVLTLVGLLVLLSGRRSQSEPA